MYTLCFNICSLLVLGLNPVPAQGMNGDDWLSVNGRHLDLTVVDSKAYPVKVWIDKEKGVIEYTDSKSDFSEIIQLKSSHVL